jgi:hypothetical protein
MRLAISGTHGSGKTTLAEDFLAAHPGYRHVPEPYEALIDAGAAFSDPPTIDDFAEQLEASIALLHQHAREGDVVFERCPLDFLAYIAVLERRSGEDGFDIDASRDEIAEALAVLDLIVFLPLPADGTMAAELPKLQRAVDRELRTLLRDDPLALRVDGAPRAIALRGTRAERLAALDRAVALRGREA